MNAASWSVFLMILVSRSPQRRRLGRGLRLDFGDSGDQRCSGHGDEHEMPTYGTLQTDAVAGAFHEANYSGTMMLEVFYNVDRLKQIIDEGCAERLARIIRIANGQPTQ